MQKDKYNIAILGATGCVGQVLLSLLSERQFPVGELYPLASHRSLGKKVAFNDKDIDVIDVETFDFTKADIAFFSAGGSVSKVYAPIAAKAKCVVIDNTSEFRLDDDIPLVVPEVNGDKIKDYQNRYIIANPNCSTIQMLVALKPIHDAVKIKRIVVSTYQSVSGAGNQAIDELHLQSQQILNKEPIEAKAFPCQIAFNAIPHIDTFQDNGYTREEMKMVWETQKIFDDKDIKVNPTAVRLPIVFGHSEAISIETEKKLSAAEAITLLKKAPGVKVKNGNEPGGYPTAAVEANGTDPVFVGRIREDISLVNGLNLWVVSDNIRKGAALNSIQIAENLIERYI